MKSVEVIDQIHFEGMSGDLDTIERKARMWMRAWISEHIDPRPEARVSYTVTLSQNSDPVFKVSSYVQVYSEEGFFQAFDVGKDPRRAIKSALKILEQRLNEARAPHKQVLLPIGYVVQQAS